MQVPEKLVLIGGSILLSSTLIFTLKSQSSTILPKVGKEASTTFQSDKFQSPNSNDSKEDSTTRTIHVHFLNRWEIGNQDLGSKDISVKQGDTVNMNSISPSGYAGFFGTIPHFNNNLANYSYNRIINKADKEGNFNYYLGSTTPNEVPLDIEYYYNDSIVGNGKAYFDLNAISSSDQLDASKQVPMPSGYHLDKSSNLGETSQYPYVSGNDVETSSQLNPMLSEEFAVAPDK